MFAPAHHPAMRHAAPVRRELGDAYRIQRARPAHEPRRRPRAGDRRLLARARADASPRCSRSSARGARSSCTAHTASTSSRRPARTSCARSSTATVRERVIDPIDFGIPRCDPAELRGGSPEENADAIREVFAGADGGAPRRHPAQRGRRDRGRRARGRPARGARSSPVEAIDSGAAADAARRAREVHPMGGLTTRWQVPGSARSPRSSGARPRRATSARTPIPRSSRAAYARAGAAAVSVLVDELFGGDWDDLRAARAATGVPLLPRASSRPRSTCARRRRQAPTPRCCCSATSTTRRRGAARRGARARPRHARRGARRRRARARGRARGARDRRQRPRPLDVRDRPAPQLALVARIPRDRVVDRRERRARRGRRAQPPSSPAQTRSSSARR